MFGERLEPNHDSREALIAYLRKNGVTHVEFDALIKRVGIVPVLDLWAIDPSRIVELFAHHRPPK